MPFCHAHLKGPRPLPPVYPQVLTTIGDHLRKRRLDLGLLQRDAADQLGVAHCTITSWELNRAAPSLRLIPRILRFLADDPRPAPRSVGEQLKAARHQSGLTQESVAGLLGVDPGTLSRWERGTRRPSQALLDRFQALFEHARLTS